jgi:hypothetical protein
MNAAKQWGGRQVRRVVHLRRAEHMGGGAECGAKRWMFLTFSVGDITCKRCRAALAKAGL